MSAAPGRYQASSHRSPEGEGTLMSWTRWPLTIAGRWLVPLLLIVFALLAMTLRYNHQMRQIDQDVSTQESRRLRERLSIEQTRMDVQASQGNTLLLHRLVGGLALHQGLDQAYLVGTEGRVLASLSRLDIGQPLTAVLSRASNPLLALAATPSLSVIVVERPDQQPVLTGLVPVQGSQRLLVQMDLSYPLALRRASEQTELVREGLVLLAAVALLALLLHLLWFRRAQSLALALTEMGAGRLSVRTGLIGRDELAHIGEAADRMAEQLQAGQDRIRRMSDIINRSPLVVIEWRNADGWPVSYASDSVSQWGYASAELMDGQLQYIDLIHPDDVQQVNDEVTRYFAHGPDEYRQEYRIRRADGGWAWVNDHTSLTRNAGGEVISISGILLDTTVQKAAQLTQHEQAEQLRMFYELPFLGMAISSPMDKRWLQVNDRLCEILGYSRDELLSMTWAQMTPPGDLERNVALFDELLTGLRSGYQMAKRFVRKDGRTVHTEIDVRAVRDRDGRIRQLFATIQDVTERKQAEAALQDSERQLREAQRIGRMGSWAYDLRSGEVTWSEETYRLQELDPETYRPSYENFLSLIHPDDVARVGETYQRSVEQGTVYETRYRIRVPSGRIKHLHVRGETLFEEGQPVRTLGMVVDETDLIEAQRERDRLVSVMETSTDIVSMADPTGCVFYFNGAGYEMLGLQPGDPLDDAIRQVHPPWAAQRVHDEGVPTAIATGRWLGETAVIDAQGREVPMSQLIMAHRGADDQVEYLWTILRDISERKAAEAALSRERSQLTEAQAVAHIGSWNIQMPDSVLSWSAEHYRILGLDPQQTLPSLSDFLNMVHPDDRQRLRQHIEADMARQTEGTNRIEYRIVTEQGVRHLEARANLEKDARGQVVRIFGTTMDITEAVQAEEQLRQINQELERRVTERTAQLSQANQELEAFSYTVSHDLKAPLRGIDGYSQLLVEEYGERLDDEGRRFVERIRKGVQQMGDLIADLLAYSRIERRDMVHEPVALLPLVEQIVDSYHADIQKQGAEVHLAMEPFTLPLDREGMAVVLRNLIGNALKFSRGSASPRIEIGARHEPGRRILWVRDNGVGFDPKYHDRIFGIFQRLHRAEEFPGTGVGLALVAKAVQRMGGRVWAESQAGAGATFYLEFPE